MIAADSLVGDDREGGHVTVDQPIEVAVEVEVALRIGDGRGVEVGVGDGELHASVALGGGEDRLEGRCARAHGLALHRADGRNDRKEDEEDDGGGPHVEVPVAVSTRTRSGDGLERLS